MVGLIRALGGAMLAQGGLQFLLGCGVAIAGLAEDGSDALVIVPVVLLLFNGQALLWLAAGAAALTLRYRPFVIGALLTAPLSFCTCYCGQSGIILMILGLLLLVRQEAAAVFAWAAEGLSDAEISDRLAAMNEVSEADR
jgi:hypothetical protein